MELELKHLAPYLPYGLKCQYEGIINGKEIAKHKKEFEKENTPFTNWEYYEPILEVKGLKIAPLKTIRTYKKYWVATCGIYNNGQKNFYNGLGIKPILRPLSDLNKIIEINGEVFVPTSKMTLDADLDLDAYERSYVNLDEFLDNYFLLLSWHFDIFGLLEQDLAVDINTL
jgi:hypothetical protein